MLFLFFACSIFAFSEPSYAQKDMNDRLNRMENDIQTLSRALYKGEPYKGLSSDNRTAAVASSMDATTQAKIELRLSQLEIEIRSLTGKIEQQSFEIRQVTANVDRMLADLEMRISELEEKSAKGENVMDRGASTSPQYSPPSEGSIVSYDVKESSIAGKLPVENQGQVSGETGTLSSADRLIPAVPGEEVMPSGHLGTLVQTQDDDGNKKYKRPEAQTPSELYEQAFMLLREKDYEQASSFFEAFLERYPGHTLAANAKYWLGETYYVRNDYERAARIFAEAYQQYPDGSKGPDSLLKLGMSLAGMGKTEDACLSYMQIKRQYSAGAGPIIARAEQEMKTLGCP